MKRHLTRTEEFDILKIVINKVLLLAVLIIGYGLYKITYLIDNLWINLSIMGFGCILLALFVFVMVRSFEYEKR